MKSMKDLMSLFEMDSDKKEDSKECKTCKKDPCKCDTELDEALMREYKHYVGEALPQGQQQGQPPAQGQQQPPAQAGTAQAGAQAQAQKPAAPAQGQPPAQPGQPPKPPAPAGGQQPQQPAQPGQPPKPPAPAGQPQQPAQPGGAPAPAGQPAQPAQPDPNAIKQTTDQLTKVLGNPQDPKNAELQDLLKKAGLMK